MNSADVIRFWFEEIAPKQWWDKDASFDTRVREHFLDVHRAAARGELFSWRRTPEGRLAEVVVLDQFSRNIYRETAQAFAHDALALVLAQEAVAAKADRALAAPKASFLYMPYMHSESVLIHEQAVELFSEPALKFALDFELKHKAIIDRFGRYPHRNAVLGRASTAEEIEFLSQPGSAF